MGLLNNKKSSFTKAQQAVKNLETSLNQLQNDSTKKGGVKDKNSGSLETGGDSEYYDEFGESEQSELSDVLTMKRQQLAAASGIVAGTYQATHAEKQESKEEA